MNLQPLGSKTMKDSTPKTYKDCSLFTNNKNLFFFPTGTGNSPILPMSDFTPIQQHKFMF